MITKVCGLSTVQPVTQLSYDVHTVMFMNLARHACEACFVTVAPKDTCEPCLRRGP